MQSARTKMQKIIMDLVEEATMYLLIQITYRNQGNFHTSVISQETQVVMSKGNHN